MQARTFQADYFRQELGSQSVNRHLSQTNHLHQQAFLPILQAGLQAGTQQTQQTPVTGVTDLKAMDTTGPMPSVAHALVGPD